MDKFYYANQVSLHVKKIDVKMSEVLIMEITLAD